jgi:hypothetical protein
VLADEAEATRDAGQLGFVAAAYGLAVGCSAAMALARPEERELSALPRRRAHGATIY